MISKNNSRFFGQMLSVYLVLSSITATAQEGVANGKQVSPLFERYLIQDIGKEQIAPDPLDNHAKPNLDALPSEQSALQKLVKDPQMVTEDYLKTHPEFFQELLRDLLNRGDADGLKELLTMYRSMPGQDPSVFDWGNAIIAMREGRVSDAVDLYRKLHANIPTNSLIRYQLALALMYDNQLTAARDQFEKIRATTTAQADKDEIDKYLRYIDRQDEWSFNGGLNFLHNPNINNAPKEGTEIILPNGAKVNSSTKQISANGFGYNASADKRWSLNDNLYASFDAGLYGSYYFGQKNYNDLSVSVSAGIGYQNALTDIELMPSYSYRLFGQGSSGDGSLRKYSASPALKLNLKQRLSPRLRYNGSLRLGYNQFVDKYDYQKGRSLSFSNTLLFTRNQNQFFYAGLDFVDKNAKDASNAYRSIGGRLGWGEEWGKGISTRLTAGLLHRHYDGPDFFNIKRKGNEYNLGLSFWHRDFHFLGVTPKFNVGLSKTKSNHPFYNNRDVNYSIDFSKTF